MNIAAEIVVVPLRLYAAGREAYKKLEESGKIDEAKDKFEDFKNSDQVKQAKEKFNEFADKAKEFGDSALEFTIRCFCEYKDYWTVYYALTENTKEALDKNGKLREDLTNDGLHLLGPGYLIWRDAIINYVKSDKEGFNHHRHFMSPHKRHKHHRHNR